MGRQVGWWGELEEVSLKSGLGEASKTGNCTGRSPEAEGACLIEGKERSVGYRPEGELIRHEDAEVPRRQLLHVHSKLSKTRE